METYSVRVLHYLNGNELCTLEDCGGDQRVAELKLLIEESAGWLPELTVLMHQRTGRAHHEEDSNLRYITPTGRAGA